MIEKQRHFLSNCISYIKSENSKRFTNDDFGVNFSFYAHRVMLVSKNNFGGFFRIYSDNDILKLQTSSGLLAEFRSGHSKQVLPISEIISEVSDMDSFQIKLAYGLDPFRINCFNDYIEDLDNFLNSLK